MTEQLHESVALVSSVSYVLFGVLLVLSNVASVLWPAAATLALLKATLSLLLIMSAIGLLYWFIVEEYRC